MVYNLGEKILPELITENLILHVLQTSSLVLAVLMSNKNTEKQIIYVILSGKLFRDSG
jgi:hypothetical protein